MSSRGVRRARRGFVLAVYATTVALLAAENAAVLRGNGAPLKPSGAEAEAPAATATTSSPAPQGFAAIVVAPREESALEFDSTAKEVSVAAGAESGTVRFTLKNSGAREIVIQQVRTSCGCSVANLPASPWRLGPGAQGAFDIVVDVRGKTGALVKTATVDTATGFRTLSFKVTVLPPDAGAELRGRNLELARVDRQAVFRGDCAKCHAEPAHGLSGEALYLAACAICHAPEHRASMVPDLAPFRASLSEADWRRIIAHGKEGTLMPGFAVENGGPLNATQIDSLTAYLRAHVSR